MSEQAAPDRPHPPQRVTDRRLLDAVVAVADGLELEPTLHRIVRAAADLTAAPFAALGVLGDDGLHRAFVHTGIDEATARRIGHLPRGHGVLGHITRLGRAVRVEDLHQHPASVGFPPGHPPMDSFLGVPVGIGDRVVGNLYLAGKPGGFTADDEDVVVALAAAAAVAVDNAGLFEDGRRRQAWLTASQEVTLATLSGAEEDEALILIARRAREVAHAQVAALVLPGLDGQWVLEIAEGEDGADVADLVGIVMPAHGRAVSVVRSGQGMVVDDLGASPTMVVPQLHRFGAALYAPLVADQDHLGVLVLLRPDSETPFTAADLATAETFASQAALALQLAEARRRAEAAELLEERARIARDLHDLVIQELFALGMRLSRLRPEVGAAATEIDRSLESVDRVVSQLRDTIRALRDPREPSGVMTRLRAEVTRARDGLGFTPQLAFVTPHGRTEPSDADLQVAPEIGDDMVAVVREGLSNAARHARAHAVEVRVEWSAGSVVVAVRDDGVGLPPHPERRSGLANLGERARRHGGSFRIGTPVSGEGQPVPQGTELLWQVPLGPSAD